jgi:hypothetical protein
MVAKPDSSTILAGSVLALLTAISQAVVLVIGWLKGSAKSVRASRLQAWHDEQAAADQAAAARGTQQTSQHGFGPPYGYPPPQFGQAPQQPGFFGQPQQGYQGDWQPPGYGQR